MRQSDSKPLVRDAQSPFEALGFEKKDDTKAFGPVTWHPMSEIERGSYHRGMKAVVSFAYRHRGHENDSLDHSRES